MTQENPRQIRELLKLMLDNTQYFSTGLCLWTVRLRDKRVITRKECGFLIRYIEENPPSSFDPTTDSYYWLIEQIEPRIKWIKKHIDKNDTTTT